MDVLRFIQSAILLALLTGCSDSSDFVLYSSLNRLPETPKPVEDWVPASEAQQVPEEEKTAEPTTGASDTTNTTGDARMPLPAGTDSAVVTAQTVDDKASVPVAATPTTDAGASATAEKQPADAASSEPREIKLLIPQKRFRQEGDFLRVSYDDIDLLKVLNMEPVPHNAVDYFPEWLNELDGRKIRIRGFMFPHFLATGIKRFALARDNGICCFVKEPKIYDVFEVSLAENEVTDYIEGKPFDVEGTFRIDPDADDTELFQLYRIENAKVIR